MKPSALRIAVLATALVLVSSSLRADVFHLSGGGTIEGELVKRTDTEMVVRIGTGTVTLGTQMVTRVEPAPSPASQYKDRLAALKPTAEAHVELAAWCEDKFLSQEAMQHYWAALKLDADNAPARTRLGFVRLEGQWVTRQEARQIRAAKAAQAAGSARTIDRNAGQRSKQYAKQLAELNRGPLSGWAYSGEFQAARETVLALQDPAAVEPLYEALARQKDVAKRQLLVDALSRIGGDEAAGRLVDVMAADPNEAVAVQAQMALRTVESEKAMLKMGSLLKTGDELARNRVAMAMGDAGSGAIESVPSLIRNLITLEERIIHHEPTESQRAWIATGTVYAYVSDVEPIVSEASVAFNPVISYLTSGCVLDVKATVEPWKEHVWVTVRHQGVLDSLIRITGRDFGWDSRAWYRWYYQDYLKNQAAQGSATVAPQ